MVRVWVSHQLQLLPICCVSTFFSFCRSLPDWLHPSPFKQIRSISASERSFKCAQEERTKHLGQYGAHYRVECHSKAPFNISPWSCALNTANELFFSHSDTQHPPTLPHWHTCALCLSLIYMNKCSVNWGDRKWFMIAHRYISIFDASLRQTNFVEKQKKKL